MRSGAEIPPFTPVSDDLSSGPNSLCTDGLNSMGSFRPQGNVLAKDRQAFGVPVFRQAITSPPPSVIHSAGAIPRSVEEYSDLWDGDTAPIFEGSTVDGVFQEQVRPRAEKFQWRNFRMHGTELKEPKKTQARTTRRRAVVLQLVWVHLQLEGRGLRPPQGVIVSKGVIRTISKAI